LCAAYIVTLPVVHAFAPSLWLPLPMDILLVFVPLYVSRVLLTRRLHRPVTTAFDLLVILLVASIYLSTAINVRGMEQTQFNHLMSYLAVIGFYYFGAKLLLNASRFTYDEIMGWLTVSVVIAAGFGLIEFVGKNFLAFDVDAWVPRPEEAVYHSTFAAVIVRSRSFMSESANFASFLDMLTPILVVHWWCKGKRLRCFLLLAVVIPALVSTFSVASVVGIFGGTLAAGALFIVSMLISGRGLRAILPMSALAGVVAACFNALLANRDALWASTIIAKVLFVDTVSASDRLNRWSGALEMISRHPIIGAGAGSFFGTSQVGQGIVSWPLQIMTEGGMVAGAIFVSLFLVVLWRAVRIPDARRYAYLMGVIALAVHYSVISDYWMPWIWFFVLLLYRVPIEGGPYRVPIYQGIVTVPTARNGAPT
jgi:O-antigen ligase